MAYRFCRLLIGTCLTLVVAFVSLEVHAQDSARTVRGADVLVQAGTIRGERDSLPYAISVRENPGPIVNTSLSLDNILLTVPGVQIDNRFNLAMGDRISIRGAGARSAFGVRGIKVLKDGIPLTFADGQSALEIINPSDIASAMVMRGAASAFYGNASGGALVFESDIYRDRTSVAATFGSFGFNKVDLQRSGAVGEMRYRLSGSIYGYDGFRTWSDARSTMINGALLAPVGHDTLRLTFDHVNFEAHSPGGLPWDSLPDRYSSTVGINVQRQIGKDAGQNQVGLTWQHPGETENLSATVYYVNRDFHNLIVPTVIDVTRHSGGLRSTWNVRPETMPIEVALGLEGQFQFDERTNHVNNDGVEGALTLDQLDQVTSGAAYGQLLWSPIENLRLMANVRYDLIRFRVDDDLITDQNPDESGGKTMDAISPSVGLSYDVLVGATLYANVSTAFESPTTTEIVNRPEGAGGINPEIEPQRSMTIEGGIKASPTEWSRIELGVFTTSTQDALISFEIPTSPGRSFFRNAGELKTSGVELDLELRPWNGMTIRTGYSYLDATYADYRLSDTVNYNGNQVPGIYPHHASVELRQFLSNGLYAAANVRHASRTFVNDQNTATAPEYTIVDATVGFAELELFRVGSLPVTIEPYVTVTNLFDRRYISAVSINAAPPQRRFYEPGAGRAVFAGVSLGY